MNVAMSKTAIASGNENQGTDVMYAVDGNKDSRWSSNWDDNAWMYVDLGKIYSINRVEIFWEAAYAKEYQIYVSMDGEKWNMIKNLTAQDGEQDTIDFDMVYTRYVKMQGVKRATSYGYSIFEFEVYGN